MTKEHLEGRAAALEDVLRILDILIEESRYTALLKHLRQELATVKEATEETAKFAPSDYQRGWSVGWDRGYDQGYDACADDYEIEIVEP